MSSMIWKDEPFEPVPLPILFLRSPLKTIIKLTHDFLTDLRPLPASPANAVSVVCISDTHSKTDEIPDGDLLVHAGDLTNSGTIADLQAQIDWLSSLPHVHKVAIAGNHDTWLDPRARKHLPDYKDSLFEGLDWKGINYLQHSSITLDFPSHGGRQLRIYGAPQIPACGGPEFAFQYPRGQDAWSGTVPGGVDVLVTHTPSIYHRDLVTGRGCEWLLREVWRTRPAVHVCGHVHAGRGRETLFWDEAQTAYEHASGKRDGFVRGVLSPWLWIDLAKVVVYGVSGLLWAGLWGGKQDATRLVNSSLTYNNTGVLGNKAQVVRI